MCTYVVGFGMIGSLPDAVVVLTKFKYNLLSEYTNKNSSNSIFCFVYNFVFYLHGERKNKEREMLVKSIE